MTPLLIIALIGFGILIYFVVGGSGAEYLSHDLDDWDDDFG